MVKTKSGNTIPEPYCWDETFKVFYEQIDTEHKGLFDGVFAVAGDMGDAGKLEALKTVVKTHFKNEEKMMEDKKYPDIVAHKALHVDFVKTLDGLSKVDQGTVDFAKEWLVDHIMTTDFKYKGKL